MKWDEEEENLGYKKGKVRGRNSFGEGRIFGIRSTSQISLPINIEQGHSFVL